jgi:transcriptional regulator with XRE-family HTH domain
VTDPGKAQYAAWLRAERQHRGWSRPALARRIIDAAHAHGDTSVPGLDSMQHNIYRWERGAAGPAEHYRLLIRTALGLPPPPPPPEPATSTSLAIPAPGNGARPAPPLTVTITIELPPGATAGITTTPTASHAP